MSQPPGRDGSLYHLILEKITLVGALVSISHFQGISAGGTFMLQEPLRCNLAVGKFLSSYTVLLHGKLTSETWFYLSDHNRTEK